MTLTLESIDDLVRYAQRNHIKPHPDGTYDLYLRPGSAVLAEAFELGLCPFTPLNHLIGPAVALNVPQEG